MKGGGQQQSSPDQSMDAFLLIAFFIGVALLLWYFYSAEIVGFIYRVRFAEGKVLLSFYQTLEQSFAFVDQEVMSLAQLESAMKSMAISSPSAVSWGEFYAVSQRFGNALILPSIIIGAMGMAYVLMFHPYSRFKQVYTMDTFSRQEVVNWPQISSVVGKNLIKESINEGPWRMSEQPLGFARRYGLLKTEVVKGQTVARLDFGLAKPVFCAQMGPLWNGLEGLPPYVLALFAIFCAKAENDDKGSRNMIRKIAASAGSGELDFGGTRLLLHKHVKSKKVGRAVSPHAYLYTVMASMLELARTDGVLSMSEFIWLKPLDRRLWYMLSNVGRRTAFVEVAAPYAHWLVEKRLRRPLKVPVIDEAMEALDQSLAQILINPDEIQS